MCCVLNFGKPLAKFLEVLTVGGTNGGGGAALKGYHFELFS